VNVASGSPGDAADWVRSVNRAGGAGGPVHFWEVGNEPYLREDVRPEAAVAPATFAVRANVFIRAMREVDDSIAIGLPLRNDRLGTLPAVTFPGYAETVLRGVTERFDFVSLHSAYMPFIGAGGKQWQPEEVFRASMAAYRVVEDDLKQTHQLLERVLPSRMFPFAITEYNAMYTVGGALDHYLATLGGALYVADLLRMLAARDDVLMANFWSLTGNWFFGAVSSDRQLRPAYHVLHAYSHVLRGQRLNMEVSAPTFDAPAVGAVPATTGVPVIAATAAVEGKRIRILVINKSASTPAIVTLRGASGPIQSAVGRELADDHVFDATHASGLLRWREVAVEAAGGPIRLTARPHSLVWLEIESAGSPD
jgi:alpha-N-arabinofuranosidase